MNQLNILVAAEFELCEKLVEFLQQSELEINKLAVLEIYPFNEEQGIRFNNKAIPQLTAEQVNWADYQYLLFAGDTSKAAHIANAAEAGCLVIDMKGVTANISGVPLVVPTVNEQQLVDIRQRNIIALPDFKVTQLVLSLSQIINQISFTQIFVTSLLPASSVNHDAISQLAGQTARLLNGIPLEENEQRFAFDVFPQSSANLALQCQKIFPGINVVFHNIRVPVFYGMGQKVTALSDYEIDLEPLTNHWQQNEFISVEEKLITPVTNGEVENNESQAKLHISELSAVENGIEFWTVADEQRFNQALLTVTLLQKILQQGY